MDTAQIAQLLQSLPPDQRAELLNANNSGFDRQMGLRYTHLDAESIAATLTVGPQHLQPYGLLHGGVYAAIAESVCSAGAAISVMKSGRSAVGLENNTSFLRAVRTGSRLDVKARPLVGGLRTQLWEAEFFDERGRLCATSKVRTLVLEPEAAVAGEKVELREGDTSPEP